MHAHTQHHLTARDCLWGRHPRNERMHRGRRRGQRSTYGEAISQHGGGGEGSRNGRSPKGADDLTHRSFGTDHERRASSTRGRGRTGSLGESGAQRGSTGDDRSEFTAAQAANAALERVGISVVVAMRRQASAMCAYIDWGVQLGAARKLNTHRQLSSRSRGGVGWARGCPQVGAGESKPGANRHQHRGIHQSASATVWGLSWQAGGNRAQMGPVGSGPEGVAFAGTHSGRQPSQEPGGGSGGRGGPVRARTAAVGRGGGRQRRSNVLVTDHNFPDVANIRT